MSLSSLFNLPSAPAQILSDHGVANNNTTNAPAPQGDAFATYMAQQMSSGQFSNWQNLTSALANQNALGANSLEQYGANQTTGFGPSPDSAITSNANNSGKSGSSTSSTSSTSQANSGVAHRKFTHLNKDQSLLGDSFDSSDSTDTDADNTTVDSSHSNTSAVSTNAWLMSASIARTAAQSSDSTGVSNTQKSGKNDGSTTPMGALPIVLPSIGAALQAQQNAIKAQNNSSSPGGKTSKTDLKTTSLSDSIQLITPNQTDTNPQSLVSFAKGMGLNESQLHQLFGADAVKANANSANGSNSLSESGNSPSTASMIGSGASTDATLQTGFSTQHDATHGLGLNTLNSVGNDQLTGSLSPAASSVLGQVSNLQVQIDQAPGATGIQSEATASTLADLNVKSTQGLASMGGANKSTPISTLEVLSEMDASLRAEDIAALQAHFESTERSSGAFNSGTDKPSISLDMNTAPTSIPVDGSGFATGLGGSGSDSSTNSNNNGSNSQSNAANVPADMAGAYEKLSNKFANEVSTRLQQQFAQGQWKMKFALRPTSLGVVDIQLEMKDGKLAANFQSNNPLTQNLIHTNSHHLRNALQGSGISESSVQVGSGQTNEQGSSSGQNSGVPYNYQSSTLSAQAPATEEIPLADDSTTTKSSNSDSQLDIFA